MKKLVKRACKITMLILKNAKKITKHIEGNEFRMSDSIKVDKSGTFHLILTFDFPIGKEK